MSSALRPSGSKQLILIGVLGMSLSIDVDTPPEVTSRYRRVVAISPPIIHAYIYIYMFLLLICFKHLTSREIYRYMVCASHLVISCSY